MKSGEILKFGVGEDMAEVIYCVYANRGVDGVVEAVMGMERGWAGGEKGREERNKKMREKNPRSKLIVNGQTHLKFSHSTCHLINCPSIVSCYFLNFKDSNQILKCIQFNQLYNETK